MNATANNVHAGDSDADGSAAASTNHNTTKEEVDDECSSSRAYCHQLKRRNKLIARIESLDGQLLAARSATDATERAFTEWMAHECGGGGTDAAAADMAAAAWRTARAMFIVKQNCVLNQAALLQQRSDAKCDIIDVGCMCEEGMEDYTCTIAATKALFEEYGDDELFTRGDLTYCRLCDRPRSTKSGLPLFEFGVHLYEHVSSSACRGRGH